MTRGDRVESRRPEPASRSEENNALAALTHEMRTPLNSIWGCLDFLAETELDEHQTRWLTLARTATDHLLHLVDGVEDFARVEMGTSARVAEKIVVNAVVLESVSLIEPIAALREAKVELGNDSDIEMIAYGDCDRLRQVLLNLLSNAIKFGPPASTVTVSTGQTGERARIEVHDDGPGIDPTLRDRVFVPFDRLDASERGIAGAGLGLALSRTLMQSMGGSLEIVSSAHTGSVFRVELPLSHAG